MTKTLLHLAGELSRGKTTSAKLVAEAFERIEAPDGEGKLAFLKHYKQQALAAADAMDWLRAGGLSPSPFAGIPISAKDLFDIADDVTTAGSVALHDAPPATSDAVAIRRLRLAGFIIVGRTNMSEFAFSGLGLNPHYGTPASPFDRRARRIPGGSTSGGAVSVTDGMAAAAIGSDTGGSCRIPAALCGIVGYKPTADAVPRQGVFPLSTTLDSIGPLANSVACCRILHGVLSGTGATSSQPLGLAGLRIGIPQTVALDGLDDHVAKDFERVVERLSKAGAHIIAAPMKMLAEVAQINAKGGFAAAESLAHHRGLLAKRGGDYDPRVRTRILRGEQQNCADYIDLLKARQSFIEIANAEVAPFDVMALPTVPTVAPLIADFDGNDELFTRVNLAMLRNPTLINMMDGCAISLPMMRQGDPPTGLMLAAGHGQDAKLFSIAAAAETALAG